MRIDHTVEPHTLMRHTQAESIQLRILDPAIGSTYPLPKYETKDSAGVDLRACIDEPCSCNTAWEKMLENYFL